MLNKFLLTIYSIFSYVKSSNILFLFCRGLKPKVNFQIILSRPATMVSQDLLTNHLYQIKLGIWKLLKAMVLETN